MTPIENKPSAGEEEEVVRYSDGTPATITEDGKMLGGSSGHGLKPDDPRTKEIARMALDARRKRIHFKHYHLSRLIQRLGEEDHHLEKDKDGNEEMVSRLTNMLRKMFDSKAPADHALLLEYGYGKPFPDAIQPGQGGLAIVYVNDWRNPQAEVKQVDENVYTESERESLPAESASGAEDSY